MAIYMQVEGIPGSATEKQHSSWIPIKSVDFPVNRPGVNTKPGKVTDRLRSAVTFPAITMSKDCDIASPELLRWMTDGLSKKVTIEFCKEKGDKICQIVLENTLLTEFKTTVSGEDQPSEGLSLDFVKIMVIYTTYDKANRPGNSAPVSFDLETATSGKD